MGNRVLVGTADGLHELSGEARIALQGHGVDCIARDKSEWWAIADGREVWRSRADGEWSRVAGLEDLQANCVLPSPAGLFVGTSEANLYALRGDALEPVRSFDEVAGRDSWFTPWGGPPDVRSMSADPAGAVYANVHVGGIARSVDGGTSWQPTVDIHSDVHQVLFEAGASLVLAASARGLGLSADGGESWRFDGDGLHGNYLRAVAVSGGTLLVSASTGPFTNRAAVYGRPLGSDGPFERCSQSLSDWFPSNIDTHCLAAAGSSAAFGTSEGSVFLSSDEGETWTLAAEGLPQVRCVAFA